ncbi:MAG: CvpA family protein [Clostridiales bacterium]|nr:CvpA family protein [Candidatus Cacconaster stercorequi]
MAIFADIAIVAILIIALALGVKRGLMASIMGVVSAVAAFFGASVAAKYLTPVAEQWVRPMLMKKLELKLQNTQSADGSTMLGALGFDGESLKTMLKSVTERMQETGEKLLEAVVNNVAHSVTYAVIFLAVFAVLLLLLGLIVKLFEKVELPVLSQLDSIGGGVLGLMEGLLVVFVAVWTMTKLHWVITPQLIEDTTFLKFFVEYTPASLIGMLTGNTI